MDKPDLGGYMKKIAIISRKPPYGDINAAEAVRHALGAVSDDIITVLIMVDSGVLLAKKAHDISDTGFTNLAEVLKDCTDMGVGVYADKLSLREHHLEAEDLVEGVKIINSSEIAGLIKEADASMIF